MNYRREQENIKRLRMTNYREKKEKKRSKMKEKGENRKMSHRE